MARRRREKPLIEGVLIEEVGAEGKSLARVEGVGVLFVPWVVPGDVVDVQVLRKRKGYAEGRAVAFRAYSPTRVAPACKHFGVCGGCQWQMLPYSLQLQAKEAQVRAQYARIGRVSVGSFRAIEGAESVWGYRNKMDYSFSPYGWVEDVTQGERKPALGFHIPKSYATIVDVESCPLQGEVADAIRSFVREYTQTHGYAYYDTVTKEGWLRSLVVRQNRAGEVMVLLVLSHDGFVTEREALCQEVRSRFPEVVSLQWGVNAKPNDSLEGVEFHVVAGTEEHLVERLGDLEFVVGAGSFFQTNSAQAEVLYNHVKRMACVGEDDVLYDLYCGTGTIGLYVGGAAQSIVGIESVESAVVDARVNATRNGITQAHFYCGDVLQVLTPEFIAKEGAPTVVVTDPPRAGMHARVVDFLLNLRAPRIVYVSCNPATQARDLQLLSVLYAVEEVQPVDMFPHTKHVESIASLRLCAQ